MNYPPAEFSHVPCSVVMDKVPPVANASEKLLDITKRLLEINYDSVLVYDADMAIGLVTIKDILKYLVETHNINNLAIGDLVTVPLITVKSETSLQEAFSKMNKFKIKYVVVEEDKKVKGIIKSSTIQEFCENNSHYLRSYT